ncbi:MAG: HYR domain-containing protein, partial [Bacteroidota bacterium]|nr:HYR domain-containing protein [Bacteroidota bacterium]
NCGGITIISNFNPGDTFDIGTSTIIYIVTDSCGRTNTCSFTITVTDDCCNKPPVISCPPDYTACPGSDINPALCGQAHAEAGNISCIAPILSYSDDTVFFSQCSVLINRIWTAEDPVNPELRVSCVQKISLQDIEAPVFTLCPIDFTINPSYNCEAIVDWQDPFAIDNCDYLTVNSNLNPNTPFNAGTTQVIYTATDLCGNISTCSFNVVVTDTCCDQPPILVCPPTFIGCPGEPTNHTHTGIANVIQGSQHCANPIISYSDSILSVGPCTGEIKILRTWAANDPINSTLRSSCIQRIELKDKEAPKFTNVPSDMFIHLQGICDTTISWGEPFVTDNCGLEFVNANFNSGHRFEKGVHRVIFTAKDKCGNISTASFYIEISYSNISIECPSDTVVSRTDPYLNGVAVLWNLPKVTFCNPCSDSMAGFVYMGELNGHRYFCSNGPQDWATARFLCKQNGGNLASITSEEENNFVSAKLNGQTAWIGGSDELSEGRFLWNDGSNFSYSKWYPGQPNNFGGNEDYIELLPDGNWNDQNGTHYREFVCEVPCYNLTQLEGPVRGSVIPCGVHSITYIASRAEDRDTCNFIVHVKCDSIGKYCQSKAQDSRLMWIDRVQMSNVDNKSGSNGGYALFENPCIQVLSGNTYSLCVTPEFLNLKYNVYWKIWVDYNADGVFQDFTELVVYGFGNTTLCADIKIPANLHSCTTRMRISMAYGGYPAHSCSQFLYGEVEDYCIAINGGSNFKTKDPSNIKFSPAIELKCIKDCDQSNKVGKVEELEDLNLGEVIRASKLDVRLFPNPAKELVSMELINGGAEYMTIYDANGKMVWKSSIDKDQKQVEIPVHSWKNGVYHVSIQGRNSEKLIVRFAIQH